MVVFRQCLLTPAVCRGAITGKVSPENEVLEFVIAREAEGYHFCIALAGRVGSEQMQRVFEDLAREELEHKARLEPEGMENGQGGGGIWHLAAA
ncbi:MAG: hypothetical protein ACYS4W_09780 [Planctomycetota bacterium]|jgi:hypothetical protein